MEDRRWDTALLAELSQAMATGVIESYMSSGSTGYDTKTYEHIKYFYDTQAWLPKNAVIANRKAFEALDKPVQQALLKAGADAEARGWALSKAKNTEYLDLLKKNGMTVTQFPPAEVAKLREKVKPVIAKYTASVGEATVNEVQSALAAMRK